MPPRKRPSAAARGYDTAHNVQAVRLRTSHIDGSPCWWCGQPLFRDKTKNWDGETLHADHSHGKQNGALADRLLHGICNKQRGDGSRDDQRPALMRIGKQSSLGDLIMGWPQ